MPRAVLSTIVLTLTCATGAAAQPTTYPRWDAGGSWGLTFTNHDDLKAFDDNDPAANALNVDFGRYFTPHLKADVGVMWSQSHYLYADPVVRPIPGLPRELSYLEWTPVTITPTTVSTALTYQFRDNELMHPYLSAGVRTIWQATHAERYASTVTIRGIRYDIPAVDERSTSVVARPFVAVGCKSYFNQWVFMRSEWLVAFGPAGYSHSTLRIGTGFDF